MGLALAPYGADVSPIRLDRGYEIEAGSVP